MKAINRLRKSLPKLEKEYQARVAAGEHSIELDMMKKVLDKAKEGLALKGEHFAKTSEK